MGVSATDNGGSVEASAVLHKSGWLAGILSNVDPKSPGNLAASFALGYKGSDFQVETFENKAVYTTALIACGWALDNYVHATKNLTRPDLRTLILF